MAEPIARSYIYWSVIASKLCRSRVKKGLCPAWDTIAGGLKNKNILTQSINIPK